MRHDVSTMQYNFLAKLCEPRKIVIPEWHEVRRKSENWKKQQLKDVDLSKVSGRLKYHRISKGVSACELDKYLGLTKGSYRKCFEDNCHETSDLEKVKSICKYLHISETEIFDDYLKFVNSDFAMTLLSRRKTLGYSQREMARRIGVDRSVYREWEKSRKVPNRTSFGRIQTCLEILRLEKD